MNCSKAPCFVSSPTGCFMESSTGNHQPYQQTLFDLTLHNVTGASSSNVNDNAKGMESAGDDVLPYTNLEQVVHQTSEPPASRSQVFEEESVDSTTAVAVERTMKKYTESLMGVLEGMAVRLSQLEKLYENIINVVSDNHGAADEKLRSLERHILDVQRGVHVLGYRQETSEAQSGLAKLHLTSTVESVPQGIVVSAPAPIISELPAELGFASPKLQALLETPRQQVVCNPSASDDPPRLQQTTLFTSPANTQAQPYLPLHQPKLQHHIQAPLPQRQRQDPKSNQEAHAQEQQQSLQQHTQNQQPNGPHCEVAHQSLSLPPPQQQQPSQPPLLLKLFYPHSEVSHPRLQHVPLQFSQQQLHNVGMFDASSSAFGESGGNPQLPFAQAVLDALPNGGGGSGTTLSGEFPVSSDRVPIDEMIDEVAAMGFSKDEVTTAVHRLTENNQAVDLVIILDKLMNEKSAITSSKGWFRR